MAATAPAPATADAKPKADRRARGALRVAMALIEGRDA